MTNWRAVAVGFVVLVLVGTLGVSVPVVGQIGAGLLGGFTAGYLAGGGLGGGAWHGLVAGALSGLVVAVVVATLGGLAGGPVGLLFGSFGVFIAVTSLTLLFAVDSAIAGAAGGWLRDRA